MRDWYVANKIFLIFFFLFPIVMDLLFGTFSIFSIIKGMLILLIGSGWIYLKYIFTKHILVDQDKQLKSWSYNLYNSLIWGLIITFLAIPSTDHDIINGEFFINILIVYILGGLFSLLFTSLEIPRLRIYLENNPVSKDSDNKKTDEKTPKAAK